MWLLKHKYVQVKYVKQNSDHHANKGHSLSAS